MTAGFIRAALRKKYDDSRRYAIAEEVGLTTGFSHRRLDMMVLDCYESNGFRIDGIEIKISRSDLRRELQDPEKHCAFFDLIDFYSIAAPEGVIDPLMDILPKKWGVLIVREDGFIRFRRRPLALRDAFCDKAVPRGFFASVVRNIQEHQPSDEELKAAYNKGVEAEKARFDYAKAEVIKNKEKLDEYQNLRNRFQLWGKDIDEAIMEFENFRKIDPEFLVRQIQSNIEHLTRLKNMIDGSVIQKESS